LKTISTQARVEAALLPEMDPNLAYSLLDLYRILKKAGMGNLSLQPFLSVMVEKKLLNTRVHKLSHIQYWMKIPGNAAERKTVTVATIQE